VKQLSNFRDPRQDKNRGPIYEGMIH